MAISSAQVEAANEAGQAKLNAGHAIAAYFNPDRNGLVVTLNTGVEIFVPVELIQDLAGSEPAKLQNVEITGAGMGLYFPDIDADVYVPGLISGIFGTKAWMAKILGAQGGAAKSKAKAGASRANGKKGGRPKSVKPARLTAKVA
jgi:hypothetical protein